MTFTWKPRPKSGLACLICAVFARHRQTKTDLVDRDEPCVGSYGDPRGWVVSYERGTPVQVFDEMPNFTRAELDLVDRDKACFVISRIRRLSRFRAKREQLEML